MPMQPMGMDRGAMLAQALQQHQGAQPEPDGDEAPPCPKCGCPCAYCSGQLPMPGDGGQGAPMPDGAPGQ